MDSRAVHIVYSPAITTRTRPSGGALRSCSAPGRPPSNPTTNRTTGPTTDRRRPADDHRAQHRDRTVDHRRAAIRGRRPQAGDRARRRGAAGGVWRALTEAEELTRWFPLQARVTPGEGGEIWMSWNGHADRPGSCGGELGRPPAAAVDRALRRPGVADRGPRSALRRPARRPLRRRRRGLSGGRATRSS